MDQENTIPFPLFKLPRVPLELCIKSMDPLQIINFASCNEDSEFFAKSINYENNFQILADYNAIHIELMGNDSRQLQRISKYVDEKQRISQAELISDLFHSDISKIQISIERFDEEYHWLQNRQKTIDYMTIFGEAISVMETENMYSTISDGTLQIKDMLKIEVYHHSDFQVDLSKLNIVAKICQGFLEIDDSQWFRLEHLMGLKVSKLILKNSGITDGEVNRLLKQWKVGGVLEHLKFLSISRDSQEPENSVVVEGINGTWNSTIRNFNSDDLLIYEGLDFHRATDGKLATLVTHIARCCATPNCIQCYFW